MNQRRLNNLDLMRFSNVRCGALIIFSPPLKIPRPQADSTPADHMIPFSELLYPGVIHDFSRLTVALILGHIFHHNVLLLLVLSVCCLPLFILSWLNGADPFFVFFWAFSWDKEQKEAPNVESSGVLKRGGGIRRKIRESLGSIGGKYLGFIGSKYLGVLEVNYGALIGLGWLVLLSSSMKVFIVYLNLNQMNFSSL